MWLAEKIGWLASLAAWDLLFCEYESLSVSATVTMAAKRTCQGERQESPANLISCSGCIVLNRGREPGVCTLGSGGAGGPCKIEVRDENSSVRCELLWHSWTSWTEGVGVTAPIRRKGPPAF
ncbi:hypothetical protein L1887_56834 [Cichorium endivia]|nr:hypothetical protein L1887_56834 [Cichorium endivia]